MSRIMGFVLFVLAFASIVLEGRPQAPTVAVPVVPQSRGGAGSPATANYPKSVRESRELTISILKKPDALYLAAREISKEFGIPISYEDPAWIGGSDLVRFVDTAQALKFPSEKLNAEFLTKTPGSIEMHWTIQNGQNALACWETPSGMPRPKWP